MNKHATIGLILAAILTAEGARAQSASTDLREVHQAVVDTSSNPAAHYGALRSLPNPTSNLAQVAWDFQSPSGGAPSTYVFTTTMNRVGYLQRVGDTDFVVAGRRFTSGNAYVGHLALLRLDFQNKTLSTVQSNDIGALDLVCLQHDAVGGRLYGIDARGRRLVAAPWVATGSLPTTFSQVFDYSTLPVLANPVLSYLESNGDASGVRVFGADGVRYTRCYSSGGQWSSDATSWQSRLTAPVITMESRFLPLNRPWPIKVYGPSPLPTGATVESEVGGPLSVAVNGVNSIACPLSPTSAPGAFGIIELATAEKSAPLDFRTCVRYGAPQNTAFYPLGEVYCDVFGPFTGRNNLVISANVLPHATNGVTQAPAIGGELRIGFRDANGNDPVVMNGDSATLGAALSVPFTVPAGDLPRDLSIAIPQIPGGLEGLTTLFQFVVTDGSQFAQSDVFGIQIRASDPWQ